MLIDILIFVSMMNDLFTIKMAAIVDDLANHCQFSTMSDIIKKADLLSLKDTLRFRRFTYVSNKICNSIYFQAFRR